MNWTIIIIIIIIIIIKEVWLEDELEATKQVVRKF
jgi:hypothetical protein